MSTGERAEFEIAVTEALAATGVHGKALITGNMIELHGNGPPVGVELGESLQQWPLLPPEMRRRKAQDFAIRLADAHRKSREAMAPREEDDGGARKRLFAGVGALLGLLAVVGLLRFLIPRLTRETKVPEKTAEDDGEKKARLGRACQGGRAQIYKGAGFGPIALEGWSAELWLATDKPSALAKSPAVMGLASNKKIPATADEELAKINDGVVEIGDFLPADLAAKSPGWSGVTVRFGMGYARAFLSTDARGRFLALAERAYVDSGATLGAFYAGCAGTAVHDVGSWFRGKDSGAAAAAMVYTMGWFSDGALVDKPAVAKFQAGNDLGALLKAGEQADASSLVAAASAEGAGITSSNGASFTFPLGAPTRALAATRAAARRMGVGLSADPSEP